MSGAKQKVDVAFLREFSSRVPSNSSRFRVDAGWSNTKVTQVIFNTMKFQIKMCVGHAIKCVFFIDFIIKVDTNEKKKKLNATI